LHLNFFLTHGVFITQELHGKSDPVVSLPVPTEFQSDIIRIRPMGLNFHPVHFCTMIKIISIPAVKKSLLYVRVKTCSTFLLIYFINCIEIWPIELTSTLMHLYSYNYLLILISTFTWINITDTINHAWSSIRKKNKNDVIHIHLEWGKNIHTASAVLYTPIRVMIRRKFL
jgi:hypothetical protein